MTRWRSLEARLTLWYSVLMFTTYVAFAFILWFGARYAVVASTDDLLDERLEHLVAFISDEPDEPDFDLEEELFDYALFVPEGHLMQFRPADGTRVLHIDAAGAPQIPWVEPAGDRLVETIPLGPVPHRRLVQRVSLVGDPWVVLLATSLETLLIIRDRLIALFLLATPPALAVSAGGGYLVARRALRPVDRITETASTIGVSNLSRRLEVPQTGDTLERLSRTLNEMFDRLEVSIKRIDQFSADASHELRTPLSVIRTTAELALKHGRTDDEYRQDLLDIKLEAERLTDLIEVLLALSREGVESGSVADDAVDLTHVSREACARYAGGTAARGLSLVPELPAHSVVVPGSEPALERLVGSLLENAIAHTPAGTITVGVEENAAGARLFVRDTGEGIQESERARIFDRLYRGDRARGGGDRRRFGLGLSIARRIAEAHDAELSVSSQLGEGSEFSVRFTSRAEPG